MTALADLGVRMPFDRVHLTPAGAERERLVRLDAPRPVMSVDRRHCRSPRFPRMLGTERAERLAGWLGRVAELNERNVGRIDRDVFEELNGHPSVVALAEEGREIAEECADWRLSRPNRRDANRPAVWCRRLLDDLLPFLDVLIGQGMMALVLGLAARSYAARIYRGTWRSSICMDRTWRAPLAKWRDHVPETRRAGDWAQQMCEQGWGCEGDLRFVTGELSGIHPNPDLGDEAARAELRRLADAIARIRACPGGELDPRATMTELMTAKGSVWLAVAWSWRNQLCTILLAPTYAQLEADLSSPITENGVAIGFDGRMAVSAMPWLTVDSVSELRGAWACNVALVDACFRSLSALTASGEWTTGGSR